VPEQDKAVGVVGVHTVSVRWSGGGHRGHVHLTYSAVVSVALSGIGFSPISAFACSVADALLLQSIAGDDCRAKQDVNCV
jgi:hypothetical protein